MTVTMDNGPMTLVREGARALIAALYNRLCSNPPTLLIGEVFLFQNDHVPSCDDGFADYTEADFAGYAPIIINPTNDGCAGILQVGDDPVGVPTLWLDQQTWVMGTPGVTNSVFGVGIWVSQDGGATKQLLAARRFAQAPAPMSEAGDSIKASGHRPLDCIVVPVIVPEA